MAKDKKVGNNKNGQRDRRGACRGGRNGSL